LRLDAGTDGLVRGLAVLGEVDAALLGLVGDAPPDRELDRKTKDGSDDRRDRDGDRHDDGLDSELAEVSTVEQTTVRTVDRGRDEAESQGAPQASNEVDADDVERVVVAELVLQADGESREDTGDGTHEDRADGRDVASSRGDRDETRDDAGRGTERSRLAVAETLGEQPATDRRG